MTETRVCRRCERPMVAQRTAAPVGAVMHMARGLCSGCYRWASRNDGLADFAPQTRPAAEVVEEYEFFAEQGLTRAQIADRLGMKPDSVYRALYRNRARERAA